MPVSCNHYRHVDLMFMRNSPLSSRSMQDSPFHRKSAFSYTSKVLELISPRQATIIQLSIALHRHRSHRKNLWSKYHRLWHLTLEPASIARPPYPLWLARMSLRGTHTMHRARDTRCRFSDPAYTYLFFHYHLLWFGEYSTARSAGRVATSALR